MAEPVDTDALAQQIAEDAASPQATSFDGTSVQNRSLSDQIEALKYLENRNSAIAKRSPLGSPIKLIRSGDALG